VGNLAVKKITILAAAVGTAMSATSSWAAADEEILLKMDVARYVAIMTVYSSHCYAKRITPMLPEVFLSTLSKAAEAQNIDMKSPELLAKVIADKAFSDIEAIAQYPNLLEEWCHKTFNQMSGRQ
jgi:hypothetical protein